MPEELVSANLGVLGTVKVSLCAGASAYCLTCNVLTTPASGLQLAALTGWSNTQSEFTPATNTMIFSGSKVMECHST